MQHFNQNDRSVQELIIVTNDITYKLNDLTMVGIAVLQQIKQYKAGPGHMLMIMSDTSDSMSVCFLVLIVLESLCIELLTHYNKPTCSGTSK